MSCRPQEIRRGHQKCRMVNQTLALTENKHKTKQDERKIHRQHWDDNCQENYKLDFLLPSTEVTSKKLRVSTGHYRTGILRFHLARKLLENLTKTHKIFETSWSYNLYQCTDQLLYVFHSKLSQIGLIWASMSILAVNIVTLFWTLVRCWISVTLQQLHAEQQYGNFDSIVLL